MKIVGICGSLRANSYNRKLLNIVVDKLKSRGFEAGEARIDNLPLYNQDNEENMPVEVKRFKEQLTGADAFVFITPEYNFSLPGAFKNAIDWASRPGADVPQVFGGKVALIGGVSSGARATARAQMHMLSVGHTLKMIISPWTIAIGPASEAFSDKGQLVGNSDMKQVDTAVEKFAELMEKLRG